MNIKTLVAVAVAATGALGAGMAQARTDVQWSVTIGNPFPVYSQPAPVYSEPYPVYAPAPVVVRPYPVYTPAPVMVRPYPVYGVRYGDRDGDGIPNRYDHRYNPYGDRDRDGIPNRYDRHPGHPAGQPWGR